MAKVSPTQRSLRLLRQEGGCPAIVEKFNSFIKIRQDAWGFVDIISLNPSKGEITFVQVTTMAHLPEHREKCFANPNLKNLLDAGGVFELHGWRKLKEKILNGKKGRREVWKCEIERYIDFREIPTTKQENTSF